MDDGECWLCPDAFRRIFSIEEHSPEHKESLCSLGYRLWMLAHLLATSCGIRFTRTFYLCICLHCASWHSRRPTGIDQVLDE